MFVRIIRHVSKTTEFVVAGAHESLHECRRIRIRPVNAYRFEMTLEGSSDTITVEIDKRENIEVYAMNESGRTIDTIFKNTN